MQMVFYMRHVASLLSSVRISLNHLAWDILWLVWSIVKSLPWLSYVLCGITFVIDMHHNMSLVMITQLFIKY